MKKDHLLLQCEAKLQLGQSADEAQNPSGKIEAIATTWGAREGADGRKFFYKPEGFKAWADEFTSAGKPMPMFLNHNDMGMPVGQWDEISFDENGMTAKGKLFIETSAGADIYHVLKESPDLFGGVSVGAYADEAVWVDSNGEPLQPGQDGSIYSNPKWQDDEAYFQITQGGLREVSVVMYPNNPAAEVTKLECFDAEGQLNPRVVEEALREAGLSKKGATTASSVFKKILESRDASKEIVKEAPQSGEPKAVVIEADTLLAKLNERDLLKALSNRIK